MAKGKYTGKIIEELLAQLAEGKGLAEICRDKRMPNRATVHRWAHADDELAARIMEAREIGYHQRAERAVEAAKSAKDPIAGRLAFDAERWYLGKLSQAFADKPIAIGALLNVGGDDAFAAVTGALERAASAIASSGERTITVVDDGEAGSGDAAGRLANLAGESRPGIRQDAGGG